MSINEEKPEGIFLSELIKIKKRELMWAKHHFKRNPSTKNKNKVFYLEYDILKLEESLKCAERDYNLYFKASGIDPGNKDSSVVAVYKARQLGGVFDSYVGFMKQYMNFPQPTGQEQGEYLDKLFTEQGLLFVTPDDKDISWAIKQLKKGEIVRNSAWPEEMIGIALEISNDNSGNIVLIEDQNFLKPKYKFTNQDVLFGEWEIVK